VCLDIPALQTEDSQVEGIMCLQDCPNILSVGYRCQELGYGFYWPPGKDYAYLIPPGSVTPFIIKGSATGLVKCQADRWIPYLQDPDNPELSQPVAAVAPQAATPFSEGGASGSGGSDPKAAAADDDQSVEIVEFTNVEALKLQAQSLEHLATHSTFNQYCQTCRESKPNRTQARNKKTKGKGSRAKW
jgi:hypothetical protein